MAWADFAVADWSRQGPKCDLVLRLRLPTLERVLAKDPNHPGAIHIYIHDGGYPDGERVNESDHTLITHVEGSTFPNFDGVSIDLHRRAAGYLD